MREEILKKTSRRGTSIIFFDTMLPIQSENQHYAYLIYDNQNKPLQILTFDGKTKWIRNENNSFVDSDSLQINTLTGTVYSQAVEYILSDNKKATIENNFKNNTNILFSGLSKSYVIYEEQEIDDLFVNIFLERSYKNLDTLSVFNNLVNSFPSQESETGTVFGKLIATQKIKDQEGNRIKIPLKNVPIGIFNPSELFPAETSVDENGNRISLNLAESSNTADYFNQESFKFDTEKILLSGSVFNTVPDHYKFVTYTNDEGEFVIHNVPVGTQNIMFEVDLFKQGLTKDEIALNFFPFPSDEIPFIDDIPSYFFRQIPIDVIPNWGSFQTGYTEVNINANLDLRKWATFFIPPVTIDGNTLEFLSSRGNNKPLTISVRDMATEGFPIRDIEIVEVPDILNREENQQLMWKDEFKQIKNRVNFRNTKWSAFKLPANCYDPSGFKTDNNGMPTTNKGTWLSVYQMNMYFDGENINSRKTGLRKTLYDNKIVSRSHFNLNHNIDVYQNSEIEVSGLGLNTFPYEKPWNHIYPEKYKIPSIPKTQSQLFYNLSDDGKIIVENPKYTDGDMPGTPYYDFIEQDTFSGGTGGYSVSYDLSSNRYFKNDFSKIVTKNYMYKYENTQDGNDLYSNGYIANDPLFQTNPEISFVLNGEKYQRVECGYGYFLRPEGWHRTAYFNNSDGEAQSVFKQDTIHENNIVTPDLATNQEHTTNIDYTTSMNVYSEDSGQKESLNLGLNSRVKNGALHIYRIINSSPNENLNPFEAQVYKTTVRLHFQTIRVQNAYTNKGIFGQNTKFVEDGEGTNPQQEHFKIWGDIINPNTKSEGKLFIQNRGVKTSVVKIIGGNEFVLEPNQSIEITDSETGLGTFNNMIIEVEGNAAFDYTQNYYTRAFYAFEFRNIKFFRSISNSDDLKKTNDYRIIDQAYLTSPTSVLDYYMRSISNEISVRSDLFGNQTCGGNFFNLETSIEYRGLLMDGFKDKRHSFSYFGPQQTSFTCLEDTGYFVVPFDYPILLIVAITNEQQEIQDILNTGG